jgi:hypothetical protein
MLRKTIIALAAAAAIGVTALPATEASAWGWHRGWHHYGWHRHYVGIAITAGTAITDGTVGTDAGADAPACRAPKHRPCGAGPVRRLSGH